jgi:hypothetical protein
VDGRVGAGVARGLTFAVGFFLGFAFALQCVLALVHRWCGLLSLDAGAPPSDASDSRIASQLT